MISERLSELISPKVGLIREIAPQGRGADEPMPWDFIDHHVAKSYLWKERQKALLARETPPCDVSTCKTCGAC